MKILKKIWFRVLISIVLGAIIAELYHFKTGNSSPQLGNMILVFVGSVIFSVLSLFVWSTKAWGLFFPKDSNDDNILDD